MTPQLESPATPVARFSTRANRRSGHQADRPAAFGLMPAYRFNAVSAAVDVMMITGAGAGVSAPHSETRAISSEVVEASV